MFLRKKSKSSKGKKKLPQSERMGFLPTLSGGEAANRSMYARRSFLDAGGKLGTPRTMSTQRFPSVARSTLFRTPFLASPPTTGSQTPPFPAVICREAEAPRAKQAGGRADLLGGRWRVVRTSIGNEDSGLQRHGGFRVLRAIDRRTSGYPVGG